ncbi:hypothetical protein, partial [Devosia indica]|uniref:hypothetical protein n=1 Tax=Devosia indica TaxID=2079253 RepID=UPI001FE49B09
NKRHDHERQEQASLIIGKRLTADGTIVVLLKVVMKEPAFAAVRAFALRTPLDWGLSVISCVAGDCILRRHGSDEALAEDYSELRLGHGPFTWRH